MRDLKAPDAVCIRGAVRTKGHITIKTTIIKADPDDNSLGGYIRSFHCPNIFEAHYFIITL